MVRLLKRADALIVGAGLEWRDHCRAAKKRARKVQFTRGRPNRVQLYRELIAIARATLAYLEQASACLASAPDPFVDLWQSQVRPYRPLIERIIRQSERRVLAGEPVPVRVGQPVRRTQLFAAKGLMLYFRRNPAVCGEFAREGRTTMDKNRNAKPAEDQGVIVAGTDARARARGEVKDDDGKPRDVRDAPTENPPTGNESKGPPTPKVGADVPSRPSKHDGPKLITGA